MKILSMTATFGKLEQETLTLKPELNIIQAPNEWGKSTWCAFLVAMFYGIDTKAHSTKTALADKERYTPWSGSPMSGRIDLIWKGKAVTIERRTKGRSIFGDFKAYETDTGLPVAELTASNCGQLLLGVEKSVFLRAGFLKLTDLPVTQDEVLRRRLNALVTTGDESGAGDVLAQKLKDLKNKCRFNKTGLLPQAEAQRAEISHKLSQLQSLQAQDQHIRQRQAELEEYSQQLENHRDALQYASNCSHAKKLASAEEARDRIAQKLSSLQSTCKELPSRDEAEENLERVRKLQDRLDSIRMEEQMLPTPPELPVYPACFQNTAPGQVTSDRKTYDALQNSRKKPSHLFPVLALLLLLAGVALVYFRQLIPGSIAFGGSLVCLILHFVHRVAIRKYNRELDRNLEALLQKYYPLPPEQWEQTAVRFADDLAAYNRALEKYREDRGDLDHRLTELKQQLQALLEGSSLREYLEKWRKIAQIHNTLEDTLREYSQAESLVQALTDTQKAVPAPRFPDTLTFGEAETAKRLSDTVFQQRQLQLQLGQCQGQMEALGQEAQLRLQLDAVNTRISRLEDTYAALTLAQDTLAAAANTLQRRFAPRISSRTRELFAKLTGNRYDRLLLNENLSLSTGAAGENILRPGHWRSDGTIDQLYLALRLAVAEELTPDAPMILDDALVRFDDTRLAAALNILKEEANTKQILLFTCQDRENRLLEETSL